MKTILIRKGKLGFEHCMEPYSSAPTWKGFPNDIKTLAQMKQYFAEGRHSPYARQNIYDIELSFVDLKGARVKHYQIQRDEQFMFAVVDFDRTKKLAVPLSKIWAENDQLDYLRGNATYLPTDISTVHEATEYLRQNEPVTIELFEAELTQRATEGMKEQCQAHATEYFKATPIIEIAEG
jgi:hypothetical protein